MKTIIRRATPLLRRCPNTTSISLILSVCAVIAYLQAPGYLLWGDSFARWTFSKAIATQGIGADYLAQGYGNWHPTFPVLLAAAVYWLTHRITAFAFLQLAIAAVGIFTVLKYCVPRGVALICSIAIVSHPTNLTYLVTHMPEPLLIGFALGVLALLVGKDKIIANLGITAYLCLLFLFFISAVWVRPNFAICAPAIAFFALNGNKARASYAVILVICSVAFFHIWDKALGVDKFEVSSIGIAAEIAGISQRTNGTVCASCLDFVGNTAHARIHYRDEDAGFMLWEKSGGLEPEKVALKKNAAKLRELWLSSIVAAPWEFLQIKLNKAYWLFGVDKVGLMYFIDARSLETKLTEEICNCKLGSGRETAGLLTQHVPFQFLYERPIVAFAIAAVLILFGSRSDKNIGRAASMLYIIALVYYLGYLLNMQRAEFRYFYPSWLMLMIGSILAGYAIVVGYLKPAVVKRLRN